MIRDRSTISIKSPCSLPIAPTHVKRILVDESAFNAVEGQPKLIQGFLHRGADGRLLRFADGVTLHRERADFHVLFVYSHVQRPIPDVLGLGTKTIVLGQTVDDARHSLVRGSFQTESLASEKLQPASLVHEQLAPIEKSLGLRKRFDSIQLFLRITAGLREANKQALVAVRTGDLPSPLLDYVFYPHFLQLGIVRTAAEHRRNGFRKRLG